MGQNCFRKNLSVIYALLNLVINSYNTIHHKQHTALLFMDPKKAFDLMILF